MQECGRKLIELQRRAGGAASGIRTHLRPGRFEVTTAGFDPFLQLVGSDPWNSSTYTGLVVPTTPTTTAQKRYLFQLARISFNVGETATLVGLRLYASLFGFDESGAGPYELQILSPLWRFLLGGGNISWHVMVLPKTWRNVRNPANADSFIFLDSSGPALLYQDAVHYVPPNGGRPWGKPIAHDLGNMHDLRYPWRDSQVESELHIPIPPSSDVAVYASVWQHDPGSEQMLNQPTFTSAQAAAASPEDRFWAAFTKVQYGRVAASLIFEEELGKQIEYDGGGCGCAGPEPAVRLIKAVD